MSDALFILGLLILIVAAFIFSVVLGLVAAGLSCVVLGLGLSDGKGLRLWR